MDAGTWARELHLAKHWYDWPSDDREAIELQNLFERDEDLHVGRSNDAKSSTTNSALADQERFAQIQSQALRDDLKRATA